MPYRLTYFDEIPLPLAMPTDDISTASVESALRDSVGGVFDYYQSLVSLPRRQKFLHKGIYEGSIRYRVTSDGDYRVTSSGDYRVASDSAVRDLQGQTDDLKAKIGVTGQVWRERLADGALTWKQCRLLHVKHVETVDQASVISEVESEFETTMVAWRAEVATTSSINTTSGSTSTLNVSNAGLMTVEDAILRISRTSGTITSVHVTGDGVDLIWTGSIGAGETLEIDAGLDTVTIDDEDEYSGFELGSGHASVNYLPLQRGTNLFQVTVSGGNATVSVEHYNQFP